MDIKHLEVLKIEIAKLYLEKDDTLVLKVPKDTTESGMKYFTNSLKDLFPNNRTVVLSNDMDLQVVKEVN